MNIRKKISSFFVWTFAVVGIGFSAKVGYEVYKGRTIQEPEPLTYVTKAIRITQDQAVQTVAQFSDKFKHEATEPDNYETILLALGDTISSALRYTQKEDSLETSTQNRLVAEFKSLETQVDHLIKYYRKNPLSENSLSGIAGDATEIVHKRNLERKRLALVNKTESSIQKLVNIINGEEADVMVARTAEDGIQHAHALLSLLVR